MDSSNHTEQMKHENLLKKLLKNELSFAELIELRKKICETDLSFIIQHIYDLNEKQILDLAALERLMKLFNNNKNNRRNNHFKKLMKKGFRDKRYPANKIVLAEGDSWFNYPVILTDLIDAVSMDPNLAVYSLAEGGDWLLNMLTGRKYIEQLSILKPDFFLISGGGNDIVGARRLAAIVSPKPDNSIYKNSEFVQHLMKNANPQFVKLNESDFNTGVAYLSKDFYSLLMFFHLQYYFMMNGILNGGESKTTKFPGIKIITQGYDYPIPNYRKGFGKDITNWYIPFVRTLLGNGSWLKTPLQIRGITDGELQRKIVYAMIYLFNEMMIDIGKVFNTDVNRVFHIDSRDFVGKNGWTDELHPQPGKFLDIGRVFSWCIHNHINPASISYDHVFVVSDIIKQIKK